MAFLYKGERMSSRTSLTRSVAIAGVYPRAIINDDLGWERRESFFRQGSPLGEDCPGSSSLARSEVAKALQRALSAGSNPAARILPSLSPPLFAARRSCRLLVRIFGGSFDRNLIHRVTLLRMSRGRDNLKSSLRVSSGGFRRNQ